MKRNTPTLFALIIAIVLLTGCSYNPLSGNNHLTGTTPSTLVGAGVGTAGAALADGSKPVLGISALAGGAAGYYLSTLRYDAGGIYQAGGQVYQLGLYTGIYIPSDELFEPNTADFLPQADAVLDSAVIVLKRQPDNNILISGNTSGFGHARWEQKLSERRAGKVASYLWNAGVNQFKGLSIDSRKLNYVGYGDYFPIATHLTNTGIRQNSSIQITSYPSTADLKLDNRHQTFRNIGGMKDTVSDPNAKAPCGKYNCYQE